jgi:DNA-binding transcriptional regulator LsrR (DeoR family)
VPVARVQRERARAIEPRMAQRITYLGRVLGLAPSTIAAQLGVTETSVVRVLSAD